MNKEWVAEDVKEFIRDYVEVCVKHRMQFQGGVTLIHEGMVYKYMEVFFRDTSAALMVFPVGHWKDKVQVELEFDVEEGSHE